MTKTTSFWSFPVYFLFPFLLFLCLYPKFHSISPFFSPAPSDSPFFLQSPLIFLPFPSCQISSSRPSPSLSLRPDLLLLPGFPSSSPGFSLLLPGFPSPSPFPSPPIRLSFPNPSSPKSTSPFPRRIGSFWPLPSPIISPKMSRLSLLILLLFSYVVASALASDSIVDEDPLIRQVVSDGAAEDSDVNLFNADHHFTLFKSKYRKTYATQEEHDYRFGVFKANMLRAKSSGSTTTTGLARTS